MVFALTLTLCLPVSVGRSWAESHAAISAGDGLALGLALVPALPLEVLLVLGALLAFGAPPGFKDGTAPLVVVD